MTALRCNAAIEAFADRLAERGKEKMVIIGAAMRKLLLICFGVLKNQAPFDPRCTQGNRINFPDLRLQRSKADFAIETKGRPRLQTVRAAPPGRS